MNGVTEIWHKTSSDNSLEISDVEKKLECLRLLKKVFEEPTIQAHYDVLETVGRAYQMRSKSTFQNYIYDQNSKEYTALNHLYDHLDRLQVQRDTHNFNLIKALLEHRTIPAICENFLVLINTQIDRYERDCPKLHACQEEEVTKFAYSATLKISLAVTLLITVGSALTAASTLGCMNSPSVVFLLALHAPQVVMIAAAVVGALMVAYGLYLGFRMVFVARTIEEVAYENVSVESETLSAAISVDTKQPYHLSCFGFSNLFSGGVKEEASSDTEDNQLKGCSMQLYFGSRFISFK